jgi:hypothetical protein
VFCLQGLGSDWFSECSCRKAAMVVGSSKVSLFQGLFLATELAAIGWFPLVATFFDRVRDTSRQGKFF